MRIHHVAILPACGISLYAAALSVKMQGGIESDGSASLVVAQTSVGGATMQGDMIGHVGHSESVAKVNSTWNSDVYPTEKYLKSRSSDWLFHVHTTSCQGLAFDIQSESLQSRLLLPFLFLCTLVAISMTSFGGVPSQAAAGHFVANNHSAGYADVPDGQASPDGMSPRKLSLSNLNYEEKKRERLWHLDFARICAVFCVVGEHSGGEDYTHRNAIFGLWWVLPYLYMTSGMGCVMSKKSMPAYVARLLCIFFVGVGANWIADVATKRDWQHDFGNTVYHMFFIVMLITMAIVSEPLRAALQRRQDHALASNTKTSIIASIVLGIVTLLGLWHFMLSIPVLQAGSGNSWLAYYQTIFDNIPIFAAQVGGVLFLSTLGACVCAPQKTGMIGWYLLVYTYVPMVLIPWDESNFSHCMALYVIAMVATIWPLRGSQAISDWVRSYWALLLIILMIFSMPDMWGRCDEHPPYAVWERLRFNLGELTLVVCFLTGAFAMSDPYGVTTWLGYWALYAYCFHVMWFRLLGTPYGAVVTFSFIGVFYLLHRMGIFGIKDENKKPNPAVRNPSTDAMAKV
jgi:hypothetical protein